MADTTVKYIHSGMGGTEGLYAPVLAGQAGSMIALLDAVLVNGFATQTVDSIVVASNVATVTRSAGHPFEAGSVALISGAAPAGLNGEQRVVSATTTTYTFATTSISDQTATGTITHKVAPLGFTKPFNGTNLAAYKSADVTSTGMYLRVDDSNTLYPRVVGYESMNGISTDLVGPFPTNTQISGGGYWAKSSAADASPRAWVIVGDSRMFYLCVAYNSGSAAYSALNVFGDPISTKSGDAYACALACHMTTLSSAGANSSEYDAWDAIQSGVFVTMPRSYSGLGGAAALRRVPNTVYTQSNSGRSGDTSNMIPYPNHPDGGLYVTPSNLFEATTGVFRATSPGFYHIPQKVGNAVFANRTKLTGVTNLAGRTLLILNSNSGCFGFDITGPWR